MVPARPPTPCKSTKSRLPDAEITKGRRSLHPSVSKLLLCAFTLVTCYNVCLICEGSRGFQKETAAMWTNNPLPPRCALYRSSHRAQNIGRFSSLISISRLCVWSPQFGKRNFMTDVGAIWIITQLPRLTTERFTDLKSDNRLPSEYKKSWKCWARYWEYQILGIEETNSSAKESCRRNELD